ncbi:transposase-like protein/predicted RNA methylase [Bradyrhizobium sp. GM7.3]
MAAKLVWENYYANHQKKGAFKHIKVADVFMGGGTTVVEGSRLGMRVLGNDLNPVAWFVVKQQLADVQIDDVKRLLADIEAEVKPQIMPFYYCDGPRGEKGTWTHRSTEQTLGKDFDPLALKPEERKDYAYEGPEIIYTFWAKHGPCQVTGCGHRTPIMTTPVMAVKSLSVKHWEHKCSSCGANFHVEDGEARMAPSVPYYVAPDEYPFSALDPKGRVTCPSCEHAAFVKLGKPKSKKVELSLLVHPKWLAGSKKDDDLGLPFGGSSQDSAEDTCRWNMERAKTSGLVEVRGKLPDAVTFPHEDIPIKTGADGGTLSKPGCFTCASCGTETKQIEGFASIGKTAPIAAYAVQAKANDVYHDSSLLKGRYFSSFDEQRARQFNAAVTEWNIRKEGDLSLYWPRSKIPYGHETHQRRPLDRHGYKNWLDFFNERQLLVHALLLKAIDTAGDHSEATREFVLSIFQQYLRNQNMYCFWNTQRALEPMFSSNDYHPKPNSVENSVFSGLGRGDFLSCANKAIESIAWSKQPWEIAAIEETGHSDKVATTDPVIPQNTYLMCGSATNLSALDSSSYDLVITDPPFGNLLQYSELADFFYVWLRLVLRKRYPEIYSTEFSPKSLEVVSNRAREPEEPDSFYKRLLTESWREAARLLKPGGMLAFTFPS